MKKIGFSLIFVASILLSGCWAPRCPIKSCQVREEHYHDDLVSGVFMGHYLYPPTLHFFWDKNKGESNPNTDFTPGDKKPNKKLRKKFPWERW